MISPDANNRILVIDDNRAIHDDFRKILCPVETNEIDLAEADFFGERPPQLDQPVFHIDSAFQGEEGIALLRRAVAEGRPYMLAFVDVRIPPGIDGIETTERLWQICPELHVVICTAFSDYSWQEMIARLGQSDRLVVLKKPFAAVEALQLTCALTEKWKLAAQARRALEETERIVELRTRELREANERLQVEITQRKQAEELLLRTQRLESIGSLASGIAHDINNMLAPILMSLDILRGNLSDESREEIISTLEECAQRAACVVKQVLTFARGEEGERRLVDPEHLLREIEKIASETFPRTINIRFRVPENLFRVEADPTQLLQVLMNLCVNARDAMPDGGMLLIEAENLEIDAHDASMIPGSRLGPHIVIRITDTGTGIPDGIAQKIFDPFFTTKPVGKGTGLGLSVADSIIRSHEGYIKVQSALGKGTTFGIYIPAALGGASVVSSAQETPLPAGNGELILVVDDEPGIRSVTGQILAKYGYRALTAADGAEAITTYTGHTGDIRAVITDITMPTMDGIALCRELRKMSPEIRILATSGEAEESRFAELTLLNVPACLKKPFTTEKLLNALHEILL